MRTTRLPSYLLIIAIIFLLSGCGGGAKETTFKGSSVAYNLGQSWGGDIENDAVAGATIDFLLKAPDDRKLKTVILSAGIEDLGKDPQASDKTIINYALLFWSIKAEKVYCIGIPPVHGNSPYDSSLWPEIKELNEFIKTICGADRYVDTWAMPFTSDDGVHPDAAMNALIKAQILKMSL